MTEPRRLRGHTAAAICCIASRIRPGLVATAAEDGRVCWYDLRCKDMLFSMDVGNGDAVSALCFMPGHMIAGVGICQFRSIQSDFVSVGNEDIIYVSVGNEVKCFDLHMECLDFSISSISSTYLESVAILTQSHPICQIASWKQLESYSYNKDEINQIACHQKSSFLAAADDAGDVKDVIWRPYERFNVPPQRIFFTT
ncbi:UNVERIFIED_CONTAM: hypothetical protein Slati_1984800 [Sesamum latifolium]|uniref:Uncharacterized protein n=1 Tax=Sesamum latifolium TaxID=2727402 RepID=A0AAW2WPD0_9LAMI